MGRKLNLTLSFFLVFFVLSSSALAQTTCEKKDCKITITIKMAFAGATDQQISDWKNDIENVWNGNGQVTGDCKCPVSFKVETMKITNASQVNCNPGPAGYHCVMVTSFATNPPKDTNGTTYVGYMYGTSQGGASTNGWWSDQMNRGAPGGGTYHDAAHEAGHMMGLGDKEGDGLMTHTSGNNAKPTQDNIDNAVKNVCGPDACPDRCCCGDGKIDRGKGETCDPFANPNGCTKGEACCPVCCSCYAPDCDPQDGEYDSLEDCQQSCAPGSACYQNYKTGCWDCVESTVVEVEYMGDFALSMEECLHPDAPELPVIELEMIRDFYNSNIQAYPEVANLFVNERINIYLEGFGVVNVVTQNSEIVEISEGELPDPTVNMHSDLETVEGIVGGGISVTEALQDGRITFEGVGFFNTIRFAFANFLFSVWMMFGGG